MVSTRIQPPAPAAVVATPVAASPSGRLAALTGAAVAIAAMPIPFLPDRLITRVRGAVVHDVTARHGLSLTTDARALFAAPDRDARAAAVVRKSLELLARQLFRPLGPLGTLAAAARGLEVFALGLLLDRYIVAVRPTGTVRVHAEEARKVRAAIDRAVLRSVSPALRPHQLTLRTGAEDLRDEYTRYIDTFLLTGAAIPSYIERRLESAFDDVCAESPELYDD